MEIRVGVLTVSDKGSRGERRDTSGPAIAEMMATIGGRMERYEVVPDEAHAIAERLRAWADDEALDVVINADGRLEEAVDRLAAIIEDEKRRPGRRAPIIP